MDPILHLANKYNITVIEDACQAHGAEYYSRRDVCWKKAGSMGKAGAFSFYPGKNLGACGEAGAITTNDERLAKMCRQLRDHGQAQKYYHDIEGYNGRLDAVQAGLLRVKLEHLPVWNHKRRDHATYYYKLFSGLSEVATPVQPSWAKAVYHLYVVRVSDRDALQQHLKNTNIGTGIHYPIPLHMQKAYAGRFTQGDFPVAERVAREILSLPMYPQLREDQQQRVYQAVMEFSAAIAPLPASGGR
jgi:dTDP-4-amino-4,6-dideoxygalactose transaminase